jgi:hypothetical protein
VRAKFSVTISARKDGSRPDNDDFLKPVRANGWALIDIETIDAEPERQKRYDEEAAKLWGEMPEVTAEERAHVIFVGLLEDTRTRVLVTRRTSAQATFRLLHTNLARLQRATAKVVSELVATHRGEAPLNIADKEVIIYERGHEEILIEGRVIPNAAREAVTADKKNLLVAVASAVVVTAVGVWLGAIDRQAHPDIVANLDKLLATFIGFLILSVLGLFQTWWEIRENRVVSWTVASEPRLRGARIAAT